MGLNMKKYYAGATYIFSDGAGTGDVTLATTTKLPDNAIVNEVSIYCEQPITSVGGCSIKVIAGAIDLTTAIAKADLTNEAVVTGMGTLPAAGVKLTAAADIGIEVVTTAVTSPVGPLALKDILQIRVGYFIGTAE
tara:strand:+ start:69 stop:476 length:408 start_codon:yes stop_codon:yes gene_type:complete